MARDQLAQLRRDLLLAQHAPDPVQVVEPAVAAAPRSVGGQQSRAHLCAQALRETDDQTTGDQLVDGSAEHALRGRPGLGRIDRALARSGPEAMTFAIIGS